jgi:hypothetical protein
MVELAVLGRIVGAVVLNLVDDFWAPFEAGGGVEAVAAGGDMMVETEVRL